MRAAVGSQTYPGIGVLGVVVVAELWTPLRATPAVDSYFRVRDLGIRCIRAPCFSMRAWKINRPYRITVSDLDLSSLKLTSEESARAVAALSTPGGLAVAGRVTPSAEGGRTLRASQAYLKVATPRA